MKNPLVSVIIVSYNTRDLTLKCLQSVYASSSIKPADLEVIVVDNNSSDETVAAIRDNFPDCVVIARRDNLGFGAGNNQGVSRAHGQYLLFLNTDAFLEPTTLDTLIKTLAAQAGIYAVGPAYTYASGSFQQSAGYFPTVGRVMGWMWGLDKLPLIKALFAPPYHLYDPHWYRRSRSVDWLMGACVLLRRPDFNRVGGFDEKMFMYGEEIELSLRLAKQTNQSSYFASHASIIHLGSASTANSPSLRLRLELQGIEYIYAKHYPSLLWIIRFIIYTGVMLRIIVFSLLPGRRQAVLEYKKYFKSNT